MSDFLDKIIARRSAQNPDISNLIDRAVDRRRQRRVPELPEDVDISASSNRCLQTPAVPATPERAAV